MYANGTHRKIEKTKYPKPNKLLQKKPEKVSVPKVTHKRWSKYVHDNEQCETKSRHDILESHSWRQVIDDRIARRPTEEPPRRTKLQKQTHERRRKACVWHHMEHAPNPGNHINFPRELSLSSRCLFLSCHVHVYWYKMLDPNLCTFVVRVMLADCDPSSRCLVLAGKCSMAWRMAFPVRKLARTTHCRCLLGTSSSKLVPFQREEALCR